MEPDEHRAMSNARQPQNRIEGAFLLARRDERLPSKSIEINRTSFVSILPLRSKHLLKFLPENQKPKHRFS